MSQKLLNKKAMRPPKGFDIEKHSLASYADAGSFLSLLNGGNLRNAFARQFVGGVPPLKETVEGASQGNAHQDSDRLDRVTSDRS